MTKNMLHSLLMAAAVTTSASACLAQTVVRGVRQNAGPSSLITTAPVLDRECGARLRRGETCIRARQLLTPVTLTFDQEQDYKNFVSGGLKVSMIIKNETTGRVIGFAPSLFRGINFGDRVNAGTAQSREEGAADTHEGRVIPFKSTITLNIIIDNFASPLGETPAGFEVALLPTPEGSDFAFGLTYFAAENAQSMGDLGGLTQSMACGTPIRGIIVKGGRNPGGNIAINVGQSEVITRGAATRLLDQPTPGSLVLFSSKGTDPRNPSF